MTAEKFSRKSSRRFRQTTSPALRANRKKPKNSFPVSAPWAKARTDRAISPADQAPPVRERRRAERAVAVRVCNNSYASLSHHSSRQGNSKGHAARYRDVFLSEPGYVGGQWSRTHHFPRIHLYVPENRVSGFRIHRSVLPAR